MKFLGEKTQGPTGADTNLLLKISPLIRYGENRLGYFLSMLLFLLSDNGLLTNCFANVY